MVGTSRHVLVKTIFALACLEVKRRTECDIVRDQFLEVKKQAPSQGARPILGHQKLSITCVKVQQQAARAGQHAVHIQKVRRELLGVVIDAYQKHDSM